MGSRSPIKTSDNPRSAVPSVSQDSRNTRSRDTQVEGDKSELRKRPLEGESSLPSHTVPPLRFFPYLSCIAVLDSEADQEGTSTPAREDSPGATKRPKIDRDKAKAHDRKGREAAGGAGAGASSSGSRMLAGAMRAANDKSEEK